MPINTVPVPSSGGPFFSIVVTTRGISSNTNSAANNNVAGSASFIVNTAVPSGSYLSNGLGSDNNLVSTTKSTSGSIGSETSTVISPVIALTSDASTIKLSIPARWTSRSTIAPGGASGQEIWSSSAMGGVAAIGNTWIVARSTSNQIIRSTDNAVTWGSAINAGLTIGNLQTIRVANSRFWYLCTNGYINTSTDGLTWATSAVVWGTNQGPATDLVYGNVYMAFFQPQNGQNAALWSTNGTTWATRSINSGAINGVTSAAWGSSGWVALAYADAPFINTSTDGITWTTRNGNFTTTNYWYGIVWNGSKYYAFGQDYLGTANNNVRSSTDGITWTLETSTSPTLKMSNWNLVIWSTIANCFVMPTNDNSLVISSDAITWTSKEHRTNGINQIAYNSTNAMLVGAIFSSASSVGTNIMWSGSDFCGFTTTMGSVLFERKGDVTLKV